MLRERFFALSALLALLGRVEVKRMLRVDFVSFDTSKALPDATVTAPVAVGEAAGDGPGRVWTAAPLIFLRLISHGVSGVTGGRGGIHLNTFPMPKTRGLLSEERRHRPASLLYALIVFIGLLHRRRFNTHLGSLLVY